MFDPTKERIEDYIERQFRERLGEEAWALLEEMEVNPMSDVVHRTKELTAWLERKREFLEGVEEEGGNSSPIFQELKDDLQEAVTCGLERLTKISSWLLGIEHD